MAFPIAWDAWESMAAGACAGMRAAGLPIDVRLRPSAEDFPVGLGEVEDRAPLGPPLEAMAVAVAPEEKALAASLRGFRWRMGLGIGIPAVLLLAATSLGARNLARAAALSRARAELALSASHEIKTPLTVLRAAAETLATRDLDAEARRPYLRTLVVETRRLTEIVSRALELRRLEEGPVRLERAPHDLGALAREAVASYRPLLDEARFACEVDAPEEVVAPVDAESIVSALLAVLENAVRYTPPGAPPERRRIAVTVRRDGSRGTIEVVDRGIGIPPEERERVFEPHHRVRSELFASVRGAGLGLAIVREVLRRHGGDAAVAESRPDGTVVRLRVPLEG
jgi:signal transduction histidine kinase